MYFSELVFLLRITTNLFCFYCVENCCPNGKIVYRKESGATSCDVANNEIQKRRRCTTQNSTNTQESCKKDMCVLEYFWLYCVL